MAKRKKQPAASPERPSRAKDPSELIHDPHGLDRVRVTIRLRQEFYEAVEAHRGHRSWGAAAHEALEAGLRSLGWI